MGLFKKFKEALPTIAGVAGFAIGGPTGAAIGSGLGSLAAGKSVNDALVNAAMGYGVGSMGQAAGFTAAPKGATGFSQFVPGREMSTYTPFGDAITKPVKNLGIGSGLTPDKSFGLGSLFDSDMLKYGALGAGALALSGGLGGEEETSSGSFYDDSYEGQARGKVVGPTSNKEYNINSPADMDKYNQEILNLQKYEKRTRAAGGEYNPIRGYAAGGEHIGGGEVDGPGTGTSDSVPARLSDGEFVLTAKAVRGAGGGDRDIGAARIYDMMADLEATA